MSSNVGSQKTDNIQDQNNSIVQQLEEKHYDYDSIKNLSRRIHKISDKKILKAIIIIIKTMNPEVSITENDNGMFIKFNSLTQQTYAKLDNYIHKNVTKKLSDESENPTTTEYITYSPDETDASTAKYKLSNKEKTLIKKQNYSHVTVV